VRTRGRSLLVSFLFSFSHLRCQGIAADEVLRRWVDAFGAASHVTLQVVQEELQQLCRDPQMGLVEKAGGVFSCAAAPRPREVLKPKKARTEDDRTLILRHVEQSTILSVSEKDAISRQISGRSGGNNGGNGLYVLREDDSEQLVWNCRARP